MKNISKLVALATFVMSLMATSAFAEIKVGLTLGQGVWAATGEETNLDNTSSSTGDTGDNAGAKDRKGHGAFATTMLTLQKRQIFNNQMLVVQRKTLTELVQLLLAKKCCMLF